MRVGLRRAPDVRAVGRVLHLPRAHPHAARDLGTLDDHEACGPRGRLPRIRLGLLQPSRLQASSAINMGGDLGGGGGTGGTVPPQFDMGERSG